MSSTGIHDRFVLIRAPAKLNLFLEVRDKRPDGYHEIETVMVAVSLFDSLRFQTTTDSRLDVRCIHSQALNSGGYSIPAGRENIAWRALDRLRQTGGQATERLGGTLDILKRVPDQAGLGGGSSDAAAALRAALFIWPMPTDNAGLSQVAADVGSDVPFFMEQGISLCRGRGESITLLRRNPELWFVVVKPPIGLSTKTVYEQLTLPKSPLSTTDICSAIEHGAPREIGRWMRNRLQGTAELLAPEIRRAATEFARLDCCGHQMSGSGTAYFGLFANRTAAKRAEPILRSRLSGWFVATCHSLARQSASLDPRSTVQEARCDHN